MKIESNKKEINEEIKRVDNQLTIITNSSKLNGVTSKYETKLVIRDLKREGNKNDIRHCIRIMIDIMENEKIKIPSKITVCTEILNNEIKINTLSISQVSDDILLTYNNSIGNRVKTNAYDCSADDIISYIVNYLNSFNGLNGDDEFELGLATIYPELKVIIGEMLELWSKFDIETYIEKQKELIKAHEASYLAKVNPIKNLITLFELNKDGKDMDLLLKNVYPELEEIVDQIRELGNGFDIETYLKQQKETIKLCELEYLNTIDSIKKHMRVIKQITNDLNEKKTKRL